jgi:N-acetylmuramoyl-L-alanine amidase
MIINVHAGHNPDGKKGCGAVGLIYESTENRKVAKRVIELLRDEGHTVYDCTVDNGTSANDVLRKIVNKCNAHTVDLDVSIHFNASANDKNGNGYTTGTECYIYSASSKAQDEALRICNYISALGFKNRGVKVRNNLYFLKHTKAPALLVECCFVDDYDDVKLYNTEKMAIAIASGILGKMISPKTEVVTPTVTKAENYQVKIAVKTLNIRKGAGTNYKIVGTVKKNYIYTIVETKGSWGRLKSGAGWISISTKYVKHL